MIHLKVHLYYGQCLHLHSACCLFAFYISLKNDCLPYLFCSTLSVVGMSGSGTSAGSKMEPFVTKVGRHYYCQKELHHYILYYTTLGQCLDHSFANSIVITAFFKFLLQPKGHQEPCNKVGSLNPMNAVGLDLESSQYDCNGLTHLAILLLQQEFQIYLWKAQIN